MAETCVHGGVRRKPSGERPNRNERIPPPPPPPSSRGDLISALPEDVIHRIFSFLPLRDVVRTSVLSKRWRSTWTSTTDLVFEDVSAVDDDRPRSMLDYSSLVDSVLIQSTSPTVKRFHVVAFGCAEAYSPKLDSWLRFAEARRVEDLRLWLTHSPDLPFFLYTLPRSLCRWSWLVRLEVSNCRFPLGTTIRWPCLKSLLLEFAELSDHVVEEIVRGSPVLESFELLFCEGAKNIRIDSTSVKELVLSLSSIHRTEKLWAPHLLSLMVSGFWPSGFWPHDSGGPSLVLEDVSSLVEAKLYFESSDMSIPGDLLKGLLEKLRGVPIITAGGLCLQILSLWEMEGVPSPLSNCRNLMLYAPVSQCDLPGIAYLLRSSQCLENLIINLIPQFQLDEESKDLFNFDEEDFLCSRKGNFECLAKHLKRVEIFGFGADCFRSKHLLALIKFLLEDTLVLEKLIIKANLPEQYGQKHHEAAVLWELLAERQNVLGYPRGSQNAEVIFNHSFKEASFFKAYENLGF